LPEARRAVLAMIGEAIKPHLVPADRGSERAASLPGYTLSGLDGGSADALQAGMSYLMLLKGVAESFPDQAPVCGGEFVPSLNTELGIYRGMFARGRKLGRSRLGKTFTQIDKAGFLDEYIWMDRHREAWGAIPPASLTLGKYAEWREKNLKRFKAPDFGTVTVDHPRPLALEPLSP
jgi:hypothetical protein